MIWVFDTQENLRSVLTNDSPGGCPYWDDKHSESLTDGSLTYDFSCAADHEAASFIEGYGYVAIQDLDKNLVLFQITSIEEDEDDNGRYYNVSCENAAYELIGNYIRPTTWNSYTIEQAMDGALNGTRWQRGITEFLGTQTLSFTEMTTVYQGLQDIRTTWGGEFRFRVTMQGARITGRYIDIVKKRGTVTMERFEYRRNMKGVTKTVDMSTLVTALIGQGQSTSDGSGVLTFADVEWSKAKGDPADKPLGQDWIGDEDALQTYGRNGQHVFGLYSDDNQTDANQLLLDTYNALQTQKTPSITYTVDMVLLEDGVRLGDTIVIRDTEFQPPLLFTARVVGLDLSYSDSTQDTATLGQFIPVIADSINEINTLNQRITEAKASAEKKIIKSDTAPTSPLIDDLWLDISTVPNVLKRWNGSAWEKGTPTVAGELVYSDGLTVEELKPAQAGADVTANNTAADTAAVNGTPAAIVISNINSASSTASAAQAAATNAQTTANSKAQTFISQPVPPYNVGDIYQATNAVYICTTARAAGNYTSTDWTLVGDVTSSNTAKDTEAVNGLAASTISGWSYSGTTKINGGQIQAATITAAQIAAGSITTDKLLIGNLANMIDNGTFEGDSAGSAPAGWTVTDGSTPTVVSSTASGVPTTGALGYTGNRGLNVLSVPVPTASNTACNLYTSTWISVNVGDVYFMQADAAVVGTATSAITVGLQTADQNKTANGYHSITGWTDANTTWTTNSGTIAVPSGVAYVRVLVVVHSPAAAVGAGTVYFDNIVLRPAITAEQIVSIDGGVIKAGTVDAGAIKGGTLALGGPSNGNGTAVLEDENGSQIVTMDSTGITVNGAGTFQNVTVEDATINSSTIGYQIKLQQQFKTASLPNTRLIFGDISLNPNGFHMGTFGNSAISTNDIESLGFMAWGSSIMTATQAIELAAFTANNWATNSATSFEFDIYTPVVMSSNLTVGGTISRQDGASSYQTPTFQNGFTNYGSGYRNVQYYKDAMGIVHLTGLGRIGTAGSTIFTLPAGFRPSGTLVFSTLASGQPQRIDIGASGTVTLNGGGASGNWVSLDGISFLAEQ